MADAVPFINELDSLFHGSGWVLALFGSVLRRGTGNDLDLIAVPFVAFNLRQPPDKVVAEIVQRYKGSIHGDRYVGLMETLSFTIVLPNQRVVDLSFRGHYGAY